MEENKKDVRQLIEICRGHKVYIQTHNIPDPDAIGTAFGLQQLMKHFLIVIDMQKDFVDGALGSKEAVAVVPAVVTAKEDVSDAVRSSSASITAAASTARPASDFMLSESKEAKTISEAVTAAAPSSAGAIILFSCNTSSPAFGS